MPGVDKFLSIPFMGYSFYLQKLRVYSKTFNSLYGIRFGGASRNCINSFNFQFPLWDTLIILFIIAKNALSFNSLYGILIKAVIGVIQLIKLSIPFMGYTVHFYQPQQTKELLTFNSLYGILSPLFPNTYPIKPFQFPLWDTGYS